MSDPEVARKTHEATGKNYNVATLGLYVYVTKLCLAVAGVVWLSLWQHSQARELAVAAAVLILTVGLILGAIAEQRLNSSVSHDDIERLIEDAEGRLRNDDEQSKVPNLTMAIAVLSPAAALVCWFVALCAVSSPTAPWRGVTAVLVGEAIYLSSRFESVVMKSEIETLAGNWAQGDPGAKISLACAKRVHELTTILGAYVPLGEAKRRRRRRRSS